MPPTETSQYKDIPGFEGVYEISRTGEVLSRSRRGNQGDKIKAAFQNPNGYLYIVLYSQGRQYNKCVHRLVAATYLPNPENKEQVNHINGNKLDNAVSNLEWVTPSDNIAHAFKTGLIIRKVGVLNKHTKHPEIYDTVYVMYKGGSSRTEISNALGIPVRYISSIIYKIRKGIVHASTL